MEARHRYYEKIIGVKKPYKVKIRKMTTRYGSNSLTTHSITYSLVLVHYSIDVVDSIIIHELAHAFVAKKLGYKLNNIKLIPFGICLNLNSNQISPKDEIKIAIAGPLINLFLCLILICIWWFLPSTYNFTNVFCYANLITCLFNLIPAFPLDGGRILHAMLKENFSSKKSLKLTKIINILGTPNV